ncbi:hypothetical protein ASD54_08280 [Rhizobium sp. Root149]|nr:hypothetical protein ASD54_08280 [Rhizobium sp. Root149]
MLRQVARRATTGKSIQPPRSTIEMKLRSLLLRRGHIDPVTHGDPRGVEHGGRARFHILFRMDLTRTAVVFFYIFIDLLIFVFKIKVVIRA